MYEGNGELSQSLQAGLSYSAGKKIMVKVCMSRSFNDIRFFGQQCRSISIKPSFGQEQRNGHPKMNIQPGGLVALVGHLGGNIGDLHRFRGRSLLIGCLGRWAWCFDQGFSIYVCT